MATTNEIHEPVKIAEIGATFEIGDPWRCQCGREHKWSAYAAAHWDAELVHTCECGATHEFLSGEVIA